MVLWHRIMKKDGISVNKKDLQLWALIVADIVLGSWAVLSYRKRE